MPQNFRKDPYWIRLAVRTRKQSGYSYLCKFKPVRSSAHCKAQSTISGYGLITRQELCPLYIKPSSLCPYIRTLFHGTVILNFWKRYQGVAHLYLSFDAIDNNIFERPRPLIVSFWCPFPRRPETKIEKSSGYDFSRCERHHKYR